ncbi:hypothetical protein GJS40_09735 [Aliibacillus thermotolerans]|nr:hypothetical protein [Aliibacillus thermotolerans]
MSKKDTVNPFKQGYDEHRTELDKFKEQQHVDDIPLRDLEIEEKLIKNKKKSQNTSQSEEKYKRG